MTIWMPYTNLNPPANNLSHTVWYLPFLHLQKLPSLCDFSFHRMRNSRFVKISLAYYFSCLYIGILVSLLCWALLPFIIVGYVPSPPDPIDQCSYCLFIQSNPCFSLAAYSLAIQPYHSCLSGSVFPSSHLNMLLSFLHYADTKLGCGRIRPLILLVRSMIWQKLLL